MALGAAMLVVVLTDGWPDGRLARAAVIGIGVGLGWYLARAHPTAGAVAALLAGTSGLVVGAAVGIGGFRADPSARGAAAIAASIISVVLLAAAMLRLTHGLRWRWRVPALVAAVGVVALIGYVVAPGVLATNVARLERGSQTPTDRGFPYLDVTTRTADGLTLRGWYVPSRNGAAVVLRHGTRSTVSGVLDHLTVLARAGFGVLAVDARGQGESDGQAMDFGWYGDADIVAAVDLLAARPDVDGDRIGVVGVSMGGMEAIGAAGMDPRIAAVVAEGVTRRSARDLAWLPEADGASGSVRLGLTWLQNGVTTLLSGGAPPAALADSVAAAQAQRTRFLLLAANTPSEIHTAEYIQARSSQRVTVRVLHTVDHARGLADAPDEWATAVVGFLVDALAVFSPPFHPG